MSDIPTDTKKPPPSTTDTPLLAHPGDKPPAASDTRAGAPPGPRPAAGTPAEAQGPAWVANLAQAGSAMAILTGLDQQGKRDGVIQDSKGQTFDVVKVRQQLGEIAETNLWKAVINAKSDATGSAATIFNGLRASEYYDQRMTALGKDPDVQAAMQRLGIQGDNLTPTDVQNAIIKLGIAAGPNSDLSNNAVARKLTDYLALNEAKLLTGRQVGQAQDANNAPLLAALALAEYSLDHGNGVVAVRDGNGAVVNGTDGQPKTVTAAQILDMVNKKELELAAPTIQSRAASADAQRVSALVGDGNNPLITLQDAALTNNIADYQRANTQAQGQSFNPENIQKMRDAVKAQLAAKQITDQQAQELNKGLDDMSHMRAFTALQLGQAMLNQPNPDFKGALDYLRTGAADTTLVPGGVPAVEAAVQKAQAVDQFKKDHLDLMSIATDPKFQELQKAAVADMSQVTAILHPTSPAPEPGQPAAVPGQPPPPLSPQDLVKARGLVEDAYAKGQTLSGMLEPQRAAIDSQYSTLMQKQNRTPEEEAQLSMLKPLYGALHFRTAAGLELARLDAATGDGHLAQHVVNDAANDKIFFTNNPAAQQELDQVRTIASDAVDQQAGFFSRHAKAIAFGLAAVGATIATVATFGTGALPAWGAVAAYGASLGLGAAIGAAAEKTNFGLGSSPGVAETWGESFRDTIGSAFTGVTLGATAPLVLAPLLAAAPEVAAVVPGAIAAAAPATGEVIAGVAAAAPTVTAAASPAAIGALGQLELFENLPTVLAPAADTLTAAAVPGTTGGLVTGMEDSYLAYQTAGTAFDDVIALQPAATAGEQLSLDLAGAAPGQIAGQAVRQGMYARLGGALARLPVVGPTVNAGRAVASAVPRYTGYNWLRAGMARIGTADAPIALPHQQLVNSIAARLGGGPIAAMSTNALQWTAIGAVASLPDWVQHGPGRWAEDTLAYPIVGALGTPFKAVGKLAKIGNFGIKASVLVGGDLARNAAGELVDPLTPNGDYWGHLGDRMQADFTDKLTTGTEGALFYKPLTRWLIPLVASGGVDTARAAAVYNEQQAEIDRLKEEAARQAQLAQPQHPPSPPPA